MQAVLYGFIGTKQCSVVRFRYTNRVVLNNLEVTMEYQFIRDPIAGFRVKMSAEHELVGRWLNDELAHDALPALLARLKEIKTTRDEFCLEGREVRLIVSHQEALFEAHDLYHDQTDALSAFSDDALAMEEHGLSAGCGFEDFEALLLDWQDFIRRRR
ncbi:YacL family protein [Pseudoalteromonas rubra]|uniref:UPF0231 family protein n=1 Tax=Pseudoalteromonas rubra TaxID=43658 RepID=UPI001F0C164A|nr:YacL family protein [Pseudoalteromonas rubra]